MMRRVLFLCGLLLAVGSCDRSSAPTPAASSAPAKKLRIVSMAPALTQMVVDMDMADQIVGTARIDPAVLPGTPNLGDYEHIDYEKLLLLNPTHVLTMTDASVVTSPKLIDWARGGKFILASYQVPRRIIDIMEIILTGNIEERRAEVFPTPLNEKFGLLDVLGQGDMKMLGNFTRRLNALKGVTGSTDRGKRVLLVIETNPTFLASGRGTVFHEVLTAYARATNVAITATVPAPVFNREKLLRTAPDVIVLLLPDAPPLESIEDDPRLAILRDLDIPAVKNDRIVLINHPLAQLPSTSLPTIAVLMAKAVHPQLADRIDKAMLQFKLFGNGDEGAAPDATAVNP